MEPQQTVLPRDWRDAFRRIRTQVLVASLVLLLYVLASAGILPSSAELLALAYSLLRKYGAPVVGLISFTENLVGLNVYFPGSIAILTSMALVAGDPRRALVIFIAIVIPALAAHQINFFIGRASEQDARRRGRYDSKSSLNFLFLSALWHPHFAALACIDAGAQGVSYRRFVATFTPWFLVWNTFWGLAMYFFGSVLTQRSQGSPTMLLTFLLLWLLWDLFNLNFALRSLAARMVSQYKSS